LQGKGYFVSTAGINEEIIKKIHRAAGKGRCRTSAGGDFATAGSLLAEGW
jgi:hypothetical protein